MFAFNIFQAFIIARDLVPVNRLIFLDQRHEFHTRNTMGFGLPPAVHLKGINARNALLPLFFHRRRLEHAHKFSSTDRVYKYLAPSFVTFTSSLSPGFS